MAYDASYHDQKQTNILAGFLSQEPTVENLFTTINKSFNTDEAENYLQYHERQKIDGQMSVLKPCAFAFHLNPILKPLQRLKINDVELKKYILVIHNSCINVLGFISRQVSMLDTFLVLLMVQLKLGKM